MENLNRLFRKRDALTLLIEEGMDELRSSLNRVNEQIQVEVNLLQEVA